jgi:hypothetical protein
VQLLAGRGKGSAVGDRSDDFKLSQIHQPGRLAGT